MPSTAYTPIPKLPRHVPPPWAFESPNAYPNYALRVCMDVAQARWNSTRLDITSYLNIKEVRTYDYPNEHYALPPLTPITPDQQLNGRVLLLHVGIFECLPMPMDYRQSDLQWKTDCHTALCNAWKVRDMDADSALADAMVYKEPIYIHIHMDTPRSYIWTRLDDLAIRGMASDLAVIVRRAMGLFGNDSVIVTHDLDTTQNPRMPHWDVEVSVYPPTGEVQ